MVQTPVVIIAVMLVAAVVGGMVAHRLRQPVILGYLIVGAAVGPHALGVVNDRTTVEAAAAIGVALLMFTLGLETSFSQLRQTGRVGLLGGIIQVLATFALGFLAGATIFRWPLTQASLFGLIISMSSTAVCLKILMDRGEMDSVHGRIMISILVLQDMSVVIISVVEPLMGSTLATMATALALAVGKAVAFSAVAIALGLWVLPWLMGRVGGIRTRELFLLVVLSLSLGAALSTQIFGLSSVFGAFLIGVVLHDSKFAHHALAEITPLRDIFATFFFVSLGMLFDPAFALSNWGLVLITVATIIIIKFAVVFGVVRLFGYSQRVAALSGASLFQIGEFGFLLAATGIASGLATEHFYSLILASAIITMLLTPISMSLVGRFYPGLDSVSPSPLMRAQTWSPKDTSHKGGTEKGRVILAGYGRIGENMALGLQKANIPFVVVDIDAERIATARKMGRVCLHGDASNPAVLTTLDVASAHALAVTFPDPVAVVNTVNTALELNPRIKVVARVHRAREALALQDLKGVQLVSPEYEASLEFVRQILSASGWKQSDIQKTLPMVEQDKEFVEFAADNEH